MREIYKYPALLIAIGITTGCETLGIGEDDYACRGYPGTPNCMSAREVYKATNYRDSIYPDYGGFEKDSNASDSSADTSGNTFDDDVFEYEYEADAQPRETPRFRSTPADPQAPKAIKASHQLTNNGVVTPAPYIPRMTGAMPVRTNAQVMRIWVAPWEDKDGDLHAPGLVYKEIIGRRWNFGEAQFRATRYLSPLTTGYRKPE